MAILQDERTKIIESLSELADNPESEEFKNAIERVKKIKEQLQESNKEQIISDNPQHEITVAKEPDINGVLRPQKETGLPKRTSNKHSIKRYRNSRLFKVTNKRIQKRYRNSNKGKQVIKDQNRRMGILEKLEAWARGEMFIVDSKWRELE